MFRRSVGLMFTVALGCAAGETDDFFKVDELPGETATEGGSPGGSNGSSSGGANVDSVDASGSNSTVTNAANSGENSSATSTTATTASSGGSGSGSGGNSDVATGVGGTDSGGNAGSGGVGGQGTGGVGGSLGGSGGVGGTGGAGTGGTGGDGPVIFVYEFEAVDDCVAVQCPEEAPYLVACDISFTTAFEPYFCVALEGDGVVFLKSGNACTSLGSSIARGSTLTCSSEPLENDITTEQCVTSRDSLDLVSDRCDCEMAYNIDGCF